MAGHSQFKNIMHRKSAQDTKRAKIFTKIIRELTVAARTGSEPEHNARLRAAINIAHEANVPKQKIHHAIKRGSNNIKTTFYEEIRYEGYAPGGIAIIVEALTDNRNRTTAEIRFAFNKHNGNMTETKNVIFLFERYGIITYKINLKNNEQIFEKALEAGAKDISSDNKMHKISCTPSELHKVSKNLEETLGKPQSSYLEWQPIKKVRLQLNQEKNLLSLLNMLKNNIDVQSVTSNLHV